MKNEEILKAPEELLGALDRQRRFLLRVALTPMPCPNCHSRFNQLEATGRVLNDYDFGATEPAYECPFCHRKLKRIVPLMGPVYEWMLVPEVLK